MARLDEYPRKEWVHKTARAGFATKGVLYLILGVLSVSAALGRGGSVPQNQQRVMQEIGHQPFGDVLLVVTAIGLFAYTIFRFLQAAVDVDNEGKSKKAIAKRIGYAMSGLAYAGLGVTAVQLLSGNQQSGNPQTTVAKILAEPAGQWLVGVGGLAFVAVGVLQLGKAITLSFERELKTQTMTSKERRTIRAIGRAGLSAHGVVFPIMGYFLIRAALTSDPSKARSIGGALSELARSGGGVASLAIVAAGLAAYGVYQLAVAKYRRIPAQ